MEFLSHEFIWDANKYPKYADPKVPKQIQRNFSSKCEASIACFKLTMIESFKYLILFDQLKFKENYFIDWQMYI